MRVEERYTRETANVLKTTVTVTDPKFYTKPFVLATNTYEVDSGVNLSAYGTTGEFDEQFCVPSDMDEYNRIMSWSGQVKDKDGRQCQAKSVQPVGRLNRIVPADGME